MAYVINRFLWGFVSWKADGDALMQCQFEFKANDRFLSCDLERGHKGKHISLPKGHFKFATMYDDKNTGERIAGIKTTGEEK